MLEERIRRKMSWSDRSVASGEYRLPGVVNRREELCLHLAPPTVGESLEEGMDLWRPGSDREPAGSVCWNGPGNKDFGVSGPGTAALSHTGPAATASFKAGLVLEDLGMAHPDGSFPERSLFSPRVYV